ncbi:MAG: hypothetical protein IH598_08400 [Bacteroidales bacterium]|nr:hypothetical protein [Bacteroidales bacterium]
MILKSIRFLLKAFLWLIIALIVTFFIVYAIAPVYDFQHSKPFSGENIHNPYEGMDSTCWKKGNFQIQSRVWFGITDGSNNTPTAVYAIYEQLGYDIITITDYMKINRFGVEKEGYVAAYEHGYGIRKTHQVCLGAGRVTWLDYPFYQNLNHKQHIINILQRHNEVVCVVHPRVRHGYVPAEMEVLANYDLLEAVSHYVVSLDYWDSALSSGHAVYIVSNDDSHDVLNPTKVGRYCTFINTESLEQEDILAALKAGKAFGAKINMLEGADFFQKAEDHRKIPVLKSVVVKNDTLFVELSKQARIVTFIGHKGMIKKSSSNTEKAFYPISPDDPYIRTEIIFDDNTQFFLNPVIRYDERLPERTPSPEINWIKTWLQRIIALMIAGTIMLLLVKFRKPGEKKGHLRPRQYFYE